MSPETERARRKLLAALDRHVLDGIAQDVGRWNTQLMDRPTLVETLVANWPVASIERAFAGMIKAAAS